MLTVLGENREGEIRVNVKHHKHLPVSARSTLLRKHCGLVFLATIKTRYHSPNIVIVSGPTSVLVQVGNQYCCSFPFDKAIDPAGDVILALEMNGEPIPR